MCLSDLLNWRMPIAFGAGFPQAWGIIHGLYREQFRTEMGYPGKFSLENTGLESPIVWKDT